MAGIVGLTEIQHTSGNSAMTIDTSGNLTVKTGTTTVQGENTNTTNMQQGLAKAWCDHKTAATYVLENSFNVSTLTDLHTGSADVNITNNMANVHSAATGGGGGGTGYSGVIIPDAWCFATNKFMVVTFWTDNSYYDRDYTHGVLHGDLA